MGFWNVSLLRDLVCKGLLKVAEVGQVIHGRYKLIAEIGRGGMSVVYLAQDTNLGSYWAVKQVKNTSSVEFKAFLREVELLASLSHPDIPRIVDRIQLGDDYFVVMDFVDGTSLAKILNVQGPQDEKLVIEWGIMLCNILDYLHSARANPIVYRDLKPDNIILTPSGRLKLIDFGIAQECKRGERFTGESLGTRGFAAPEQYRGGTNKLDERTDIYSLGATMFYLTTGVMPNKPPRGVPALRSVNPDLSDAFEYCIAKATADDPENRYTSATDLRKDLENIEELAVAYRTKMKRRLTLFITSLALSVVFAAVGAVGYVLFWNERQDLFQASYQAALASERDGNYTQAAASYTNAISEISTDQGVYVRLFNALLPKDGGDTARAKTMDAIDEMRKSYIDNTRSSMYHDPGLMYMIARRCIEVQDPVYAGYATEYIQLIKESQEYETNQIDQVEVQSLEVIASYQGSEAADTDYASFAQSLADLEEYTDNASISPDTRLENYYTLIQMYSTYPTNLDNAYAKAYEIGTKARAILEDNAANEGLTFNNIIPLYELIATGQYNSVPFYSRDQDKLTAYHNSLEWFGYLDDLGVSLPENLVLKRANAQLGIFELEDAPSYDLNVDTSSLDAAIGLYEGVIQKDPESFIANVYLTKALLYRALQEPQESRDMSDVLAGYQRTAELAAGNQTLDSGALMQLSALQRLLQNAGLEI